MAPGPKLVEDLGEDVFIESTHHANVQDRQGCAESRVHPGGSLSMCSSSLPRAKGLTCQRMHTSAASLSIANIKE